MSSLRYVGTARLDSSFSPGISSVRLRFEGKATGELSLGGSRGRKHRAHKEAGKVVAQLVTSQSGLYGVPFEDVFSNQRRIKTGDAPFELSGRPGPLLRACQMRKRFRKGSVLYFVSRGESLNPYGRDAVYELAVGRRRRKDCRWSKPSPQGRACLTTTRRSVSKRITCFKAG